MQVWWLDRAGIPISKFLDDCFSFQSGGGGNAKFSKVAAMCAADNACRLQSF
jgi:hypothetical protein